MQKITVAHLRRTLTPGTRVRVTNHVLPGSNRDTNVHPWTNTRDLVLWSLDSDGDPVGSHVKWPRAAEVRGDDTDPHTFHIDSMPVDPWGKPTGGPAIPFLTLTVVPDDHPDAATWPQTCRLASELVAA